MKSIYKLSMAFALVVSAVANINAQYCIPAYNIGTDDGDYIAGVELESIVNYSNGVAGDTSYSDFTSQSTQLGRSGLYTMYVQGTPAFTNDYMVWIDFNQDDVFDFGEELIYAGQIEAGDNQAFSFYVPNDAVLGTTRMRVRTTYDQGTFFDACATYDHGETEDYTIDIIDIPAPIAGFEVDPLVIDAGQQFQFTDTSSGGQPGYWEWNVSGLEDPLYWQDWWWFAQDPGTYDVQLIVSNMNGSDTLTKLNYITVLAPTAYCIPQHDSATQDGDFIDGVQLNTISNLNSGGSTSGYVDTTELVTDIYLGATHSIVITGGSWGGDYYWAYIDYNNDTIMQFNERLGFVRIFDPFGVDSIVFTVPDTVSMGNKRLRIRSVYDDDNLFACEDVEYGETEDYTVNITMPPLPVAAFEADTLSATVGEAITVTDTSGSFIYDYQWSTTNGTFVNENSNSTQVVYDVPGTYEIKLVVSNLSGADSITKVNYVTILAAPPGFCSPNHGDVDSAYIDVMYFDGILSSFPIASSIMQNGDFGSGSGLTPSLGHYLDTTELSVNIVTGGAFYLYLEGDTFGNNYYSGWIDYDNDSIFEPSELIFNNITTSSGQPVQGNVAVPDGLTAGPRRMRIMASTTFITSACGNFNGGETEDYTVNVILPNTPFVSFSDIVDPVEAGKVDYMDVDSSAGYPDSLMWIFEGNPTVNDLYDPYTNFIYYQPGVYNVSAVVWNSVGIDTILSVDEVTVLQPTEYCIAEGYSWANDSWVGGFQFGSINNLNNGAKTWDGTSYLTEDFTSMSTDVEVDSTYEIIVQNDSTQDGLGLYYVLIDLNQDLIFSPDELIDTVRISGFGNTGSIFWTVPSDIKFGTTRLRVFPSRYDGLDIFQSGPCQLRYVEHEDYTINVVPSGPVKIYDIQYTPSASGVSPLAGMTVTTHGVVTAVRSDGRFYMQDSSSTWNGIFVFENDTVVEVGDSVEVTGPVLEFFDLTEFGNGSIVKVLSSGNPIPAALEVDANTANTEPYEGVLVYVDSVEAITNVNGFNEWTGIDQHAGSIIVDDELTNPLFFDPQIGVTYNVTGIMTYAFGNRKLLPRDTLFDIWDASCVAGIASGSNVNGCSGDTVTIYGTPGSGGSTLKWYTSTTGGTSFHTGLSFFDTLDVPKTYYVATFDGASCESLDRHPIQITISGGPTANAGMDVSICFGGSTDLLASGGDTQTWDVLGAGAAKTVSPNTTTPYMVTVIDLVTGCYDRDTVVVTVNLLPNADAGNNVTICEGDTTTITATGGTSYSWNQMLGNGDSHDVNPTTTTKYIVTVTDANTCVNTDSVTVSVNGTPPANAGMDQTICAGDQATIMASGGLNYTWSHSLGTGASKTVDPSNTTDYVVTVTDANLCEAMDTVRINVNQLPNVNAGMDVAICEGLSTTLMATGAQSYTWNQMLGTGASHTVSPTSQTTYAVTGTDGNNCTSSDSVTVSINPAAVANAGMDMAVCAGDSTTLTASGGTNYQWDSNLGSTASITVSPTSTTNYGVTVTDANNCTDTDSVLVTVNPIPDQPIITQFGDDLLSNQPTGNQWLFNGIVLGAETNQSMSPVQSGIYAVEYTDANGCKNVSDDFTVLLGVREGISQMVRVYPNPARGKLFVDATKVTTRFNYSITNALGEEVKELREAQRGVNTIDLTGIESGVYFLNLSTEDKTEHVRIIVE